MSFVMAYFENSCQKPIDLLSHRFLHCLIVFCFLNIVEKVEFVRPLQDHRATRLGEDYTFEVELSRDHGRAQWLRDGMEIRSDKKYNIWNEAARHKLTIREVDDRDAGDYAILVKGHRSAAR